MQNNIVYVYVIIFKFITNLLTLKKILMLESAKKVGVNTQKQRWFLAPPLVKVSPVITVMLPIMITPLAGPISRFGGLLGALSALQPLSF